MSTLCHRSPLFASYIIYGNALGRRTALPKLRQVSVPSSSGKSLQLERGLPAGCAVQVSVPSSSGKSLQRHWPSARIVDDAVSVPSSSGKSLQREYVNPGYQYVPVSVPSSSGKSLQLRLPLACARARPVSVPSSSGKSLQLGESEELTQEQAGFSPLFIGEVSSTLFRRQSALRTTRFQSPLHRGSLFNVVSSAATETGKWFQSPLHRGSLFNLGGIIPVPKLGVVSVPSSSGKSLQQDEPLNCGDGDSVSVPSSSGKSLQLSWLTPVWPGGSVSVPSSSGKSLQRFARAQPLRIDVVSVPSSSGKSLQPHEILLGAAPGEGFSPLFIGEVSSTPHTAAVGQSHLPFQSPLHRGSLFNDNCTQPSHIIRPVSVPSSSGKSLQHL